MTSVATGPAPTYYPSFLCRFRLRFDEALHGVPPPPPQSTAEQFDPFGGAVVSQLSSDVAIASGQLPSLIQGKSADQLSQVIDIVPLRVSVEMPGYRQAGKFVIEMLYKDFPIEPDVMRSIGVEIYSGSVAAGDWGTGNTQAPAPGANFVGLGQPARKSQVAAVEDNEMMVGLVDKHDVGWTDKGFTVRLEGRDLIGILCDLYVTPAILQAHGGINTNRPITDVVQQILNKVPILSKTLANNSNSTLVSGPKHPMQVIAQKDEWPGGVIPAPGAAGDLTRVNYGANVQAPSPTSTDASGAQTGAKILPVGEINKIRVWDLITQECGLVGAVPFFRGRYLHIRPGRALYDPNKPAFNPQKATPFANGKPRQVIGVDGSNYEITWRFFAFGRNVSLLKRSRKLGGFKVPQIHVVSVDTSSKIRGKAGGHIEEWWPPLLANQAFGVSAQAATQSRATTVAPSGSASQTEPITISVPGIRSKARLLQIAQDIYEEIGRGEVGGSISTKDLASLGGDASDPDMLRMRPGDPVSFGVDNRQLQSYPPPISQAASTYRQDPEQLAKDLTPKMGDVNLARVLAYSLTGRIAERQPVYRVNHVRWAWDHDKGVEIEFDFQNYIESRAGVTTLRTSANKSKPVVTQ